MRAITSFPSTNVNPLELLSSPRARFGGLICVAQLRLVAIAVSCVGGSVKDDGTPNDLAYEPTCCCFPRRTSLVHRSHRRPQGQGNQSLTMTKGRLEAFSDGMLAIFITIMVLELKVPHGVELSALKPLLPLLL